MLGKFSLDTMIKYGGMTAGLFMICYLFTMIVMIMNFFVAILNDFLSAVANSKEMQGRDYEVMDHFLDTVKQLIVTGSDRQGTLARKLCVYRHLFVCLFVCEITQKVLNRLTKLNGEMHTRKRSDVDHVTLG